MTDSPLIPGSHSLPIATDGKFAAEWYRYFRDLIRYVQETEGNTAELAALEARLAALEDEGAIQFLSPFSVQVLGDSQYTVQLVGDTDAPGAMYYYGTDELGQKGFFARLLATLSDVDLSTPPAAGDGLVFNGSDWAPAALLANPMTTLGDIITADTGGVPQALPVGADGEVLTVVSGEPAWAAAGGGGGSAAGYATMRIKAAGFRSPQDFGGNPTTITSGINSITAQPFTVDRAVTLTALSGENTGTSATVGAKFRLGIYDNNPSGTYDQPGTLLAETGDLTVSAASVKTGAISLSLTPGVIYWCAHLANVGVAFRCLSLATFPVQWFGRSATTVNNPVNHLNYSVAGGWTNMPATWTGTYAAASANVPAVYLVE